MSQLLDRFRRVSDGKEFAVVSLGGLPNGGSLAVMDRSMTLESADGERVHSPTSTVRGHGRFERIDD